MKSITAVMVTGKPRGMAGLPQMAVRCFLNQTYENKELLIINHGQETFNGENIREIKVSKTDAMPIGALRNLAFEAARGDWLVTWDDDDSQHPDRLAWQVERTPEGRMSLFKNRLVHDLLTGESFVKSAPVGFGSTMIYPRNTTNRYENWINNSDGWFRCMFFDKVLLENPPELYIYNHHGGNLTTREMMMAKPKEEIPILPKQIDEINRMRLSLHLNPI